MTYIRDAEAAPEVLKSAANAMRHQLATANSDKYDRRTHDRLNESAVAFAEPVARKFTSAPIPEGYALVPDQPPSFACVKGEAGSYACTIEWFASLRADTTYDVTVYVRIKGDDSSESDAEAVWKGTFHSLTSGYPRFDMGASRNTVWVSRACKRSSSPA